MRTKLVELLDFIAEQGWVLCFEREVYTSINHSALRVILNDKSGNVIAIIMPSWIGDARGYSDNSYDLALTRLANKISNQDLGTFTLEERDIKTNVLVTAPELTHTKTLEKWLDKRRSCDTMVEQ